MQINQKTSRQTVTSHSKQKRRKELLYIYYIHIYLYTNISRSLSLCVYVNAAVLSLCNRYAFILLYKQQQKNKQQNDSIYECMNMNTN